MFILTIISKLGPVQFELGIIALTSICIKTGQIKCFCLEKKTGYVRQSTTVIKTVCRKWCILRYD